MKTKTVPLTQKLLRRLVREQLSNLGSGVSTEDAAKDTEEVKPGEEADSLEKHVDFVKALKLEEARLTNRLKKIRETKSRVLKKIAQNIA